MLNEKKFLTTANLCFTIQFLYAYADMETVKTIALNNYKANIAADNWGESLKTATTNTIEITGVDDARNMRTWSGGDRSGQA